MNFWRMLIWSLIKFRKLLMENQMRKNFKKYRKNLIKNKKKKDLIKRENKKN